MILYYRGEKRERREYKGKKSRVLCFPAVSRTAKLLKSGFTRIDDFEKGGKSSGKRVLSQVRHSSITWLIKPVAFFIDAVFFQSVLNVMHEQSKSGIWIDYSAIFLLQIYN